MKFIKPLMIAAFAALPLVVAPAMAQSSDPSSPAASAQMHANPATANNPTPPVAANPNGPSNAMPGGAAKNVLQNRGASGSGN